MSVRSIFLDDLFPILRLIIKQIAYTKSTTLPAGGLAADDHSRQGSTLGQAIGARATMIEAW